VEIGSEDYPSLAEFPRDQITSGNSRVESRLADTGDLAGLPYRKALALDGFAYVVHVCPLNLCPSINRGQGQLGAGSVGRHTPDW
jgi:hypothetical protein